MLCKVSDSIHAIRTGPHLHPDRTRVLLLKWYPCNDSCARRLLHTLSKMPSEEKKNLLEETIREYRHRHRGNLFSIFKDRGVQICARLSLKKQLTDPVMLMTIGSYFMHEYAIECAALFNPSIVPHFDQTGVPDESVRFILSLRSTGEQHISSITLRTGTVDCDGRVVLDPCSKYLSAPVSTDGIHFVFPDHAQDLSERVIFPVTPQQKNGVEDARFVRFKDDDGSYRYYGTYTAYDGRSIKPEMISTTDFKTITFEPLTGDIQNKGMALFPRKINGIYWMLSRQDDETTFIMHSDKLLHWENPMAIQAPTFSWELMKIGNCGSPMETEKGWLIITHGVGPMRKYSVGLLLLDLNDPTKVLGRTSRPILVSEEAERDGYVPNVVYTCGAMIHADLLILPYAVSDYSSSFAYIKLKEIWAEFKV